MEEGRKEKERERKAKLLNFESTTLDKLYHLQDCRAR